MLLHGAFNDGTYKTKPAYGLRKQEVEEGGYDIAYGFSGKLPLQESS
ncbi:hypothetical protein [Parageobacillus thermoglucosidasius]|uniref:Squalene--hopene cyclase n=2 Tax=Anoxybacillaceae TaxID=3120669 RepID=A0AAN0YPG6_PARTM|nr:hypothetical protein [Parageobacillus thermoglucosidasius]AEH47834.1 squalene-hopene-cyclase [Parageobacillus thermoglucosidasius C56-YS93]ALF10934.1 squalene-hopene cyclase [Parageobacillus thermoglucosidasius]ANZ31010.1 squalene--hopene cyclase [Parageobacillus thermoglucosidasius]APM81747.1 squalene--hopene cyclase [Parageobacillus thermoglucosidasius]KJX69201.1 squalene-hopene cyclase [Parageobacillus thermoglucosidasius]